MDWLPIIVSMLGTTSVSAVVTALLVPRTEARRLHKEVADLKSTLEDAGPGSSLELKQALEATGFRLASLSLVRFRTGITILAGAFGLTLLAFTGALIATIGSREKDFENIVSSSFTYYPVGSWAILIGLLLAAIAVGSGVGFFRVMLLKTARTKYVRGHLRSLRPPVQGPSAITGQRIRDKARRVWSRFKGYRDQFFGRMNQWVYDLLFVTD